MSVIFIKTFSIVTMHDTTSFQKQVVSETLFSVVFNNSTGSPNKCDFQFLKCIFSCIWTKCYKINSYFIGNCRYKGLTGKICWLLNVCFLFLLLELKPKCVDIHYVVCDSFWNTVWVSEYIALNSQINDELEKIWQEEILA